MSKRRGLAAHLALPLLASFLLCLASGAFAFDRPAYSRALSALGFDVMPRPFVDAEHVTSQVRCHDAGVDVYSSVPCDALGGRFNYSPAWLRLRFLGLSPEWTPFVGGSLALIFVASLGLLPVPRSGGDWALACACVASPATAFAVERANVDLLVFALCALGLRGLASRQRWAIAWLLPLAAAAALKFYPVLLLSMAAAARGMRRVVSIAVGAALVAGFAAALGEESLRAFANVPRPLVFGDAFGSSQLVGSLAYFAYPAVVPAAWWGAPLALALVAAAAGSRSRGLAAAFSAASPAERSFAVGGSLLVAGCFFAGPSVGYRGVLLALAMPGLLGIARSAACPWWFKATPALCAGCAWWLAAVWPLRSGGAVYRAFGGAPFVVAWVASQAMFFALSAGMLAVAFLFAARCASRGPSPLGLA